MARPVKRRNVESYRRDIESLGRLRTAILTDLSLDPKLSKTSIETIDILVNQLVMLTADTLKQSA